MLPADLIPGGSLLLDLTMTTLAEMDLVIGYEVTVGPDASLIFADAFEDGTTNAWGVPQP
ncbi:MAG: hypothetical protein AAGN66_25080 [Acidobacteriota bacterium]